MEKIIPLDVANLVFSEEIKALEFVKNSLQDSFTSAIDAIVSCKGKVVVVGVGKTAHVANKIVATLNSTGTPAQFLHATEAIHGDLGLLDKEDIVVCISNSGNTPEIRYILPFLKSYGKKLIAITGNKESALAKAADFLLETNVKREVFDGNVAPTSSTTVQLVMGDAIAMTLMKIKEFGKQDFAKFHPGGALGKKLFWKVKDIMSAELKPKVAFDANIKEVINAVTYGKHGITAVLKDEVVIGVITDGDLRRMLLKYDDFSQLTANDIATFSPKTIHETELASVAFSILTDNNIGQLVVLDDSNNYAGILDIHSLINEGIES